MDDENNEIDCFYFTSAQKCKDICLATPECLAYSDGLGNCCYYNDI
jgi:hypothetical protein